MGKGEGSADMHAMFVPSQQALYLTVLGGIYLCNRCITCFLIDFDNFSERQDKKLVYF